LNVKSVEKRECSDYKKELLKQLEDAEAERFIQKERKVM